MDTGPSPTTVEPNNAVAAAADERLKHAYQQIASADEQLARVTEQLSKLERNAASRPSVAPGRQPSRGSPALRGFTGLLLAACIGGAAFVSQSSSGDVAKLMIARWISPVFASSAPREQPALETPPGPVRLAAAEATTAVPASSPAPMPAQDAAAVAAPLPPELTQLLQTMSRDIADMEQKIEQLRAAQEQVATENARAIGELKASQEQTSRLIAKISEQGAQPKTPVPSPRPVANAPGRPAPTHGSPQTRSLPTTAMQSRAQQR